MAKVLIDSGPIKATYSLAEVPRERWRDLMLARRSFLAVALSHDCRCLIQFCNDAETMHEICGFPSAQRMIETGYGLNADEVDVALEWLRLNPPKEPIALNTVVRLAKRKGGQPGNKNAAKNEVDNINIVIGRSEKPKRKHQGGTDPAYILARLDRDGLTELAAKVRGGKLSANAAAIEAGFRKQKTPLERVLALLPKLTPTERRQLRVQLDEMMKPKEHAA